MKYIADIMNLIRKGMEGRKLSARAPFYLIFSLILGCVAAASLQSCSLINEDLDPCAPKPDTKTLITFKYDYNVEFTDLFEDHVGSVYLYVFDQDSTFLFREGRRKGEMLDAIDFSMEYDTTIFKPGNTYHLVAMACGNHYGYTASQETPGFVKEDLIPGVSKISDYIIKLDRDDDGNFDFGIVNYQDEYGNNTEMIDTVWSTMPDSVQTITIPDYRDYKPTVAQQPDRIVPVEIPLMRLTNAITVNMLSSGFKEDTNTDDYLVLVYFPHGNGTIDFTGYTHPAQALYYRTLRKNMVPYSSLTRRLQSRADDERYVLQSEFGVSRLQMNDESSLQVFDAESNELIYELPDFSEFLADAFSEQYGVGGQELLDRNYEYEIEISLKTTDPNPDPEDNWAYIIITIKVLNWTVRINNISL